MDFIEIGTSDFETEIQKNDSKIGLSVEPVRHYLDKLPNKKGCIKLNVAVSNYTGNATINYLSEENIDKFKLPEWVKGCNTINSYHPTVSMKLLEKGIHIKDIITSYSVECKPLVQIMTENNVSGVYYLKIDTEGHDTTILKHFYNSINNNDFLPHVVLFESNILSKEIDVKEIINILQYIGYDLVQSNHDTILKLNLTKLRNKSKFTKIENYCVMEYPAEYNPDYLPYENTLEHAQQYCIENGYTAVTYQNNRYEVRVGKYIQYHNDFDITSWIYI